MPTPEVTAVRPGLDDGGVLILVREDDAWALLSLFGGAPFWNRAIGAEDAASACVWAHQVVEGIAGTAPKPPHPIPGAHCWTLHEHTDGTIEARLVASRLHHYDGAWVIVNSSGKITQRNAAIHPDDELAAQAWSERIHRPSWRGRLTQCLRVDIGAFPDHTYWDGHGVLGKQRLRKAWNRVLAALGD
jgi:hypothetical protein